MIAIDAEIEKNDPLLYKKKYLINKNGKETTLDRTNLGLFCILIDLGLDLLC
jgi:hypothetical protein